MPKRSCLIRPGRSHDENVKTRLGPRGNRARSEGEYSSCMDDHTPSSQRRDGPLYLHHSNIPSHLLHTHARSLQDVLHAFPISNRDKDVFSLTLSSIPSHSSFSSVKPIRVLPSELASGYRARQEPTSPHPCQILTTGRRQTR